RPPAQRRRAHRPDAGLAPLSSPAALRPPRADPGMRRAEAALVSVASALQARPPALRHDRRAGIRSLPLGRLLAAGQGGHLFQAARLRPCADRAWAAGLSGRRSSRSAGVVAAPLAAGLPPELSGL